MLFISHRLEEVFGALPARDGAARRPAGHDRASSPASRRTISSARWSAASSWSACRRSRTIGDTVLRVERLTREGVFTDVSFEVRAGEIVALAGLVGAGRSEVACAIFGIDRLRRGRVTRQRPPLRARLADRRRWPPASGSCPRTGVSRGSSWTCRSRATSRSRRSGACGASGSSGARAERALRARLGDAAAGQVRPLSQPDDLALGRQPAEGRAREVARRARRRC